MDKSRFQKKIYQYYHKNKRPFPWRQTRDPYKIMVSEFMLQQTQTQRVLPKYRDFIEKLPNVTALGRAPLRQVLQLWQGLGYNSRGKRLHDSAKKIVKEFNGSVPSQVALLETLPGIGPYTSRAIATFAFDSPEVFIETNIRTVYLYFYFKNKIDVSDKQILDKVKATLDTNSPRNWYYALMDYGVMLKRTQGNLNTKSKHYSKQSKFVGSNRQLRGQVIKLLLAQPQHKNEIYSQLQFEVLRIDKTLSQLEEEQLVFCDNKGIYQIKR